MDVWEILQIESTANKEEIQKAYARLITLYHPEEYPDEFKKIYQAYRLALRTVKNKTKVILGEDKKSLEKITSKTSFQQIEIPEDIEIPVKIELPKDEDIFSDEVIVLEKVNEEEIDFTKVIDEAREHEDFKEEIVNVLKKMPLGSYGNDSKVWKNFILSETFLSYLEVIGFIEIFRSEINRKQLYLKVTVRILLSLYFLKSEEKNLLKGMRQCVKNKIKTILIAYFKKKIRMIGNKLKKTWQNIF